SHHVVIEVQHALTGLSVNGHGEPEVRKLTRTAIVNGNGHVLAALDSVLADSLLGEERDLREPHPAAAASVAPLLQVITLARGRQGGQISLHGLPGRAS